MMTIVTIWLTVVTLVFGECKQQPLVVEADFFVLVLYL